MGKKWERFIIFEEEKGNPFHPPGTFPGTMMIKVDHDILPEATFQYGGMWWTGVPEGGMDKAHPHTHHGDEILGFFGSDLDDPFNLNAEVDFWVEHEKFTFNRSALLYVPQDNQHAPMAINKVDKPMFAFSTQLSFSHVKDHNNIDDPIMDMKYLKETPSVKDWDKSKWGKNFIFEQEKDNKAHPPGSFPGTMLIAADGRNIKGANFHFGCCWWAGAVTESETYGPHIHDDDEILGLFGSNPDDPFNLNAEVDFWIEDEKYTITRSCVIYIPAGIQHCPMWYRKVDRPMFTFSINRTPFPMERTNFVNDPMFSQFKGPVQ